MSGDGDLFTIEDYLIKYIEDYHLIAKSSLILEFYIKFLVFSKG